MTDEQLNNKADAYLKLKPFIRMMGGGIRWDPNMHKRFTPTFEQFLKITEMKQPVYLNRTAQDDRVTSL